LRALPPGLDVPAVVTIAIQNWPAGRVHHARLGCSTS
jgi:hypothetical protein